MRFFRVLCRSYRFLALTLANTIIVFVLLNVAVAVARSSFGGVHRVVAKYGYDRLAAAYPGWRQDDVVQLLRETWDRPYPYDPCTQYSEGPIAGTYVNVHPAGFRRSGDRQPWLPKPNMRNVMMFGGSTGFGYGVRDDDTVAAQLQRLLERDVGADVRVYNFARGGYYSTQERALLQKLLVDGVVPDAAVFLDGLNEFYHYDDLPSYTAALQSFCAAPVAAAVTTLWDRLPANALLVRLRRYWSPDAVNPLASMAVPADDGVVEIVVRRYRDNKRLIEAAAAAFGVATVFFWQPVPFHAYDLSQDRFHDMQNPQNAYCGPGYRHMAAIASSEDLGDNFHWLADLPTDAAQALYLDDVHYTPYMCRRVAEAMADALAPVLLATRRPK